MSRGDAACWFQSRLPVIAGFAGMLALTALVLFLSGQALGPFLYASALCAAMLAIALAADALRFVRARRALARLLPGLPESLQYLPDIPPGADAGLVPVVRALEEMLRRQRTQDAARHAALRHYQTLWGHQIKTPIAAMRLLLGQEDSERGRLLRSELFRIEQYVEMALSYARLGEDASDFVFAPVPLRRVATRAARKYAAQFILKRLELTIDIPEDACAVTDAKWLAFVLEQLLSNAVKYTDRGAVSIRFDSETRALSVCDQGIGIAPEDLPRVCELGYTGYNGRVFQQSTGIGLFLCRQACRKLGIALRLTSAPGQGTQAVLTLPGDTLGME